MIPIKKETLKGSIPVIIMAVCILAAVIVIIVNDLSFSDVYDYIMINLPLQRFHDIKDCDPAVISKMNFVAGRDAELNAVSPFAGLKDIINEK